MERARRAAQHAAEQVPKDGWVEQMDPHTGEYYYYNVDTGEQTWDIPEALGGDKVPTWAEVCDPQAFRITTLTILHKNVFGKSLQTTWNLQKKHWQDTLL